MKRFFFFVVLTFIASCSSTQFETGLPSQNDFDDKSVYLIGEADRLNVAVWKSPELSGPVVVRPDGMISIPLVGDIQAKGLTAEGLAKEIASDLSAYLRNPQVTVIVQDSVSAAYTRRVRVVGAVSQPVSTAYRDGMTVMDLVLVAGGVNEFASPDKSVLYRKHGDAVKAYPIYLNDILSKGNLDTNYSLQPSDIISVPERLF